MHISRELQNRVIDKLNEGLKKAHVAFPKHTFKFPTISYDLRGRVAGTAKYLTWCVTFNPQLLSENEDDFIDRTVPHELAHLITFQVYPETQQRSAANFMFGRRGKREVHGPHWRSVMDVLGVSDNSRCHSYDVSSMKRKISSFQLECIYCGKVYGVKRRKWNQFHANHSSVWCACSRHKKPNLKVAGTNLVPPENIIPKFVPVAQPKPTFIRPAASFGESKIEVCKRLYNTNRHLTRQAMIELFVLEAKCTKAGASTYYYTCQKESAR